VASSGRVPSGWIKSIQGQIDGGVKMIQSRINLDPGMAARRRGRGQWESSTTEDEKDSGGQNGNRRRRPGRSGGDDHKQRIGGCGNPKTDSDTMLSFMH
jgi:hypothetical protein